MGTTEPVVTPSAQPPAPLGAATLDELTQRLRALRVWAGQPSFAEIVDRLRHHRARRGASPAVQRVSRTTVYDCFRSGRSRLDVDLLVDVVEALGVSADEASAWRLAYGSVTSRHEHVRFVEVRAEMASPETYFTGRTEALARLAEAPRGTTSVLVGMAGVGKTQLALWVASRLTQEPDSTPVFVAPSTTRSTARNPAGGPSRPRRSDPRASRRRIDGLGDVAAAFDDWVWSRLEHDGVVVMALAGEHPAIRRNRSGRGRDRGRDATSRTTRFGSPPPATLSGRSTACCPLVCRAWSPRSRGCRCPSGSPPGSACRSS